MRTGGALIAASLAMLLAMTPAAVQAQDPVAPHAPDAPPDAPPEPEELPPVPPPPGAPAPTPPVDPYTTPAVPADAQPSAPGAPATPAEALTPPSPPPGYGSGAPPPSAQYTTPATGAPTVWDPEVVPRSTPVDSDRRSGSEMIELYIAGASWGVLTGTWLVLLGGDPEGTGGGAIPILLGGAGAVLVFATDSALDGFPTGVPASIAMGALVGFLEGVFILPAFQDDFDTESSIATVLWGGATLGAVAGAVMGTQLRPTTGDARLVASVGLWGAYFAGLGAMVAQADGESGWRVALGGLNAGLLLGLLLAPVSDFNASRVMLLHAGVGAGSLAGLLVATMVQSDSGDLDNETTALTVGVGAAMGLLGAYLLFRPREPEPGAAPYEGARASWSPFVAPAPGGAVVGFAADL